MATNENIQAAVTEALASEMVGKKWYESKTFWTNVVAGLGVGAQIKFGFIFPAEYQVLSLSFINLVLRKITKDSVIW